MATSGDLNLAVDSRRCAATGFAPRCGLMVIEIASERACSRISMRADSAGNSACPDELPARQCHPRSRSVNISEADTGVVLPAAI